MVYQRGELPSDYLLFQYSLCRVVLMVDCSVIVSPLFWKLSVLALSSRFDGHVFSYLRQSQDCLSVLALSSRFDGL